MTDCVTLLSNDDEDVKTFGMQSKNHGPTIFFVYASFALEINYSVKILLVK